MMLELVLEYMDGLVGVQNAVDQVDNQFKQDMDSVVNSYWNAVGDCE